MYAVLKAVHFTAFMALGGGVVFWLAVWRPVYGDADDAAARVAKRIRFGVIGGAILFALSGLRKRCERRAKWSMYPCRQTFGCS